MKTDIWKETMVERKVTYMLEVEGKFILVADVPARVCLETGEHFFAPETGGDLQGLSATCRSGAIDVRGFADEQILAAIDAL
jgi:YgiT-type zinc finger domain-containing protein